MHRHVSRIDLKRNARAAFFVTALLPPLFAATVLWILPVDGLDLDRIAMAARDYTDMWAAGHLVALGQGDTLFDLSAFNAALHTMFGAGFPHQVWPYPPPILLLAVPLSMLPLLPGFLLYTAGTAALLWLALRSGGLTRAACAAVLLSPAFADNALAGQNGSLTAALLYGGLFLVQRRPVVAGAILGALVIKPQFVMLVPLCLIASGNWRALLAMVTSASLLIVASALLFGVDAWIGFLVHTRPMIAAILEAPWQALPAQQNFASPLMAARSVGASMAVAYGLQTAVTLLCGAVAWRTWRAPDFERVPRVALTGLLARRSRALGPHLRHDPTVRGDRRACRDGCAEVIGFTWLCLVLAWRRGAAADSVAFVRRKHSGCRLVSLARGSTQRKRCLGHSGLSRAPRKGRTAGHQAPTTTTTHAAMPGKGPVVTPL